MPLALILPAMFFTSY